MPGEGENCVKRAIVVFEIVLGTKFHTYPRHSGKFFLEAWGQHFFHNSIPKYSKLNRCYLENSAAAALASK